MTIGPPGTPGLHHARHSRVHGYALDFGGLLAMFAVLMTVAVRLYPTLVE